MHKNRLEAFSDGVLAIVITIMVLELKVPEGASVEVLCSLYPIFLSYVLSFVYVAIYWNNHHHMLHTVQRVTGRILWANMHLLFWLSLVPFATGFVGENHFAPLPVAVYGIVLLFAGAAYFVLQQVIIAAQGPGSLLQRAVGRDWQGKSSLVLYLVGVSVATSVPWLSMTIYVLVALLWLVPDKRIERLFGGEPS
ncbi:MAG: DUF1211 domain-containing protein [Myxococcales bacterium]|nr:DUF1211 domain-containing protein [Myxococcales bacterium]MCB9532369.1 DUF1211 domain-containing protein [Myxococcales bacterium]